MKLTTINPPASRLTISAPAPAPALVPFATSPRNSGTTHEPFRNPPRRTTALRLGHVHLKVAALDRALPFYREILGLHVTERVGRFAFLAAGREHHCLALEEIGSSAPCPPRHGRGVAHVAFEAPDLESFRATRRALLAAHVPRISRNNGTSWAMRFKDPDGNEVEVYLDRRYAPAGTFKWGGRWRAPFHLPAEPLTDELEIAS